MSHGLGSVGHSTGMDRTFLQVQVTRLSGPSVFKSKVVL